MTNEEIAGIFMLIVGIVALIFGVYLGFNVGEASIKEEAVQQGFAEYNSSTGEWQWKNKEK